MSWLPVVPRYRASGGHPHGCMRGLEFRQYVSRDSLERSLRLILSGIGEHEVRETERDQLLRKTRKRLLGLIQRKRCTSGPVIGMPEAGRVAPDLGAARIHRCDALARFCNLRLQGLGETHGVPDVGMARGVTDHDWTQRRDDQRRTR